jgi:hypothetical protein
MAEIAGMLVLGFAVGLVVSAGVFYEKGFRAGYSWAHHLIGRQL